MKFKSVFLKIFKLSELRIFRSSLFHSITAEGKKEFRNKLCFTLNRGILLVFLVLYVLTELGLILHRYFGRLYFISENLKKAREFSVPSFFFKGFQTQLLIQFLFRCLSYRARYSQYCVVLNRVQFLVKLSVKCLIIYDVTIVEMRSNKGLINCK